MPRGTIVLAMMHDTNTFSPVPTPLASFRPLVGEAAVEEFRDTNTQFGGFLDAQKRRRMRLFARQFNDGRASG